MSNLFRKLHDAVRCNSTKLDLEGVANPQLVVVGMTPLLQVNNLQL